MNNNFDVNSSNRQEIQQFTQSGIDGAEQELAKTVDANKNLPTSASTTSTKPSEDLAVIDEGRKERTSSTSVLGQMDKSQKSMPAGAKVKAFFAALFPPGGKVSTALKNAAQKAKTLFKGSPQADKSTKEFLGAVLSKPTSSTRFEPLENPHQHIQAAAEESNLKPINLAEQRIANLQFAKANLEVIYENPEMNFSELISPEVFTDIRDEILSYISANFEVRNELYSPSEITELQCATCYADLSDPMKDQFYHQLVASLDEAIEASKPSSSPVPTPAAPAAETAHEAAPIEKPAEQPAAPQITTPAEQPPPAPAARNKHLGILNRLSLAIKGQAKAESAPRPASMQVATTTPAEKKEVAPVIMLESSIRKALGIKVSIESTNTDLANERAKPLESQDQAKMRYMESFVAKQTGILEATMKELGEVHLPKVAASDPNSEWVQIASQMTGPDFDANWRDINNSLKTAQDALSGITSANVAVWGATVNIAGPQVDPRQLNETYTTLEKRDPEHAPLYESLKTGTTALTTLLNDAPASIKAAFKKDDETKNYDVDTAQLAAMPQEQKAAMQTEIREMKSKLATLREQLESIAGFEDPLAKPITNVDFTSVSNLAVANLINALNKNFRGLERLEAALTAPKLEPPPSMLGGAAVLRSAALGVPKRSTGIFSRLSRSEAPRQTQSAPSASRASVVIDPQTKLTELLHTLKSVVEYQKKLAQGQVKELRGTKLSDTVDWKDLKKEIVATLADPRLKMTETYNQFVDLLSWTLGSTRQANSGNGGIQNEDTRALIEEFANSELRQVTERLNKQVGLDVFSDFAKKYDAVSASWQKALSTILSEKNIPEELRAKLPASLQELQNDVKAKQAEIRELNKTRTELTAKRPALLSPGSESSLKALDNEIAELDARISTLRKLSDAGKQYKAALGAGDVLDEYFNTALLYTAFEGEEQRTALNRQAKGFAEAFANGTFVQKDVDQSRDKRGERASDDAVEFGRLFGAIGSAKIQALKNSPAKDLPETQELVSKAETLMARLDKALADVKADKSQKMLDKFTAAEWDELTQLFISLNAAKLNP